MIRYSEAHRRYDDIAIQKWVELVRNDIERFLLCNTPSTGDDWCFISEFINNYVCEKRGRDEVETRFHMLSHKQGYKHHADSVLYVA